MFADRLAHHNVQFYKGWSKKMYSNFVGLANGVTINVHSFLLMQLA